MIRGIDELDTMIFSHLSGMMLDGREVPVFYSEPEEVPRPPSVTKDDYPVLVFALIDERHDPNYGIGYTPQFIPDPAEPGKYKVLLPASPVIWSYQIDIYSKSRTELVKLHRLLMSRLPREFGSLVDSDGHPIYYKLVDFSDLSKYGDEERIFRYALTYEFKGFYDPQVTIDTGVGIVEYVQIEFPEQQESEETVYVPERPPD